MVSSGLRSLLPSPAGARNTPNNEVPLFILLHCAFIYLVIVFNARVLLLYAVHINCFIHKWWKKNAFVEDIFILNSEVQRLVISD